MKNLSTHSVWGFLAKYQLTVAFILVSIFGFCRFAYQGFDISSFIVAGDKIVTPNVHPYDINILSNSSGYDGQYFYQIALDPCQNNEQAFGITSNFSYRKQRIIYPVLSHIVAFGQPKLIPWTLVLVNWIAFFGLFLLSHSILDYFNVKSPYILLLALFSGPYIAYSRDLAETLNLFLLSGCFLFLIKEKKFLFILFSTLALLTREDSILIVGPCIFYNYLKVSNYKLKWLPKTILQLSIPILIFAFWKFHLTTIYGLTKAKQISLLPGQGIVEGFNRILSGNISAVNLSQKALMGYAFYCFGFYLWYIWTVTYSSKWFQFNRKTFKGLLSYSIVIWSLFSLFLSHHIYSSDLSFGRVLSSLAYLSFLLIALNTEKPNKYYVFFTFCTFCIVCVRLIIFI